MKIKRFLCSIVCVCLVLTLLPALTIPANAADAGAMTLGTSGVEEGDIVYFGNYTESGTTYDVPWVALGSGIIPAPRSGTGLPLLSKCLLGDTAFRSSGSGFYSGSTLQAAMNSLYSAMFTPREQGVVKSTDLTDVSVTDAYLFPFSLAEFNNIFETDIAEAQDITGFIVINHYWLRSSVNDTVALISGGTSSLNAIFHARPAFNLNPDTVLFASAAADGKASGSVGTGALTAASAVTPTEWKLTLEDSGRSFTAATTAVDSTAKTVTIAYSGATVGTNEYISAVILDSSDNIKYYGRIAQPTAATGTATIDLSNLGPGDTLKVFSEQYNGDYETDYASALLTVSTTGYNVTYSLTDLIASGASYAEKDTDYTAALSADTGYLCPAGISVTVGGEAAILADSAADADTAGAYYYDATTGSVKIAAVNGAVVITAAGVAKSHTISVSPESINFGSATAGYATAPAAETVTITNSGNSPVTGYTVTGDSTDFSVTYASAAIAVNGTSTFTVQPVAGLAAGAHTATLSIETTEGSTAAVSLSFTVTSKSTIGGGAIPYCAITATAGEGGRITPSGSTAAAYGADRTYTITADDGYKIEDVSVDGVSVGAVSSYTFRNVNKAHTITASFKKKTVNPFVDVAPDDWFYENVMFANENGLMSGTSADMFSPGSAMTRAMLMTVLYRMSGDTGSYTNTFTDVPSGAWFETAVAWAAATGIANGVGSNRFAPDQSITREQLAVMLFHFAKYKGYDVSVGGDTTILSYNDALTISDDAYAAMQWACGAGILQGESNGNLNPAVPASRAEAAAILQRFIEKVTG